MRFWDSSAIVPLLVQEPGTGAVRRRFEEDPELVAWWTTPTECAAALARLRREEIVTLEGESEAHRVLEELEAIWLEILPTDAVRTHAKRLLRVHPLRSADALQLGAALVWAKDSSGLELVTLDERLAVAAQLEGFRVLTA